LPPNFNNNIIINKKRKSLFREQGGVDREECEI
jgi:hypothetical protein